MGLVPQQHTQPVAPLFGDRRIFVSAPQYHWHVQGAVGTDEEVRQHLVALAQQIYEFGHQTKACKMKLWHWLGIAIQLSEVKQRVANCQQEMANEFDRFTQRLSDFINQEIHQFGQRLTLLEGTSQTSQDIGTQAREVS